MVDLLLRYGADETTVNNDSAPVQLLELLPGRFQRFPRRDSAGAASAGPSSERHQGMASPVLACDAPLSHV